MEAMSVAARINGLRRYWSLYLVQIVCAVVMWLGSEQIGVEQPRDLL